MNGPQPPPRPSLNAAAGGGSLLGIADDSNMYLVPTVGATEELLGWLGVHVDQDLDEPVPSNDADSDKEWFHGTLSRAAAKALLLKPDVEQGSFLIRESVSPLSSSSTKPSLTLSLRNGSKVGTPLNYPHPSIRTRCCAGSAATCTCTKCHQ